MLIKTITLYTGKLAAALDDMETQPIKRDLVGRSCRAPGFACICNLLEVMLQLLSLSLIPAQSFLSSSFFDGFAPLLRLFIKYGRVDELHMAVEL